MPRGGCSVWSPFSCRARGQHGETLQGDILQGGEASSPLRRIVRRSGARVPSCRRMSSGRRLVTAGADVVAPAAAGPAGEAGAAAATVGVQVAGRQQQGRRRWGQCYVGGRWGQRKRRHQRQQQWRWQRPIGQRPSSRRRRRHLLRLQSSTHQDNITCAPLDQ